MVAYDGHIDIDKVLLQTTIDIDIGSCERRNTLTNDEALKQTTKHLNERRSTLTNDEAL